MFRFCARKFQGQVLAAALLVNLLTACQPTTRRDRAALGPEATPVQDFPSQGSGQNGQSQQPDAAAAAVSGQWENDQKTACDAGKPSGCSALAYEALRGQRLTAAQQLFARACLLDESVDLCNQSAGQGKGLARSCFELSGLLQRQGQQEEAKKFKSCACGRGYRPACVM
ncbi:MAG: hypothetical protein EBR09_06865 [Proteobacteria bacterium]|nr:hypothetical protein [Pseudomonadota bacterium]